MSENTNKTLIKQQTALKVIVEITKGLIDMNPAYEKIHNIALNGLEEQHDKPSCISWPSNKRS
ncbi:hypothetical protein [Lysinibacillus sphaericus]|uniref:hypothetical protein n=1 Tax=Lysinibacillus sphaericus TaxID=1421 RepID=UPI003D00E4F5